MPTRRNGLLDPEVFFSNKYKSISRYEKNIGTKLYNFNYYLFLLTIWMDFFHFGIIEQYMRRWYVALSPWLEDKTNRHCVDCNGSGSNTVQGS